MSRKKIWYYIKNYKFNSVFLKNFIVIALLVLLPVGSICGLFYNNLVSSLKQEMQAKNDTYLIRTRDVLDTILNESKTLVINTALTQDVNNYMLFNDANLFFDNFDIRVSAFIKSYTFVFKYFKSIYVYSAKSGGLITNGYSGRFEYFTDKEWMSLYNQATDDKVCIILREGENGKKYISVFKVCFDEGDKIGAVVLNLESEEVFKIIRNYNEVSEYNIVMLNNENDIYLSNNSDFIGKKLGDMISGIKKGMGEENYLSSSINSTVFDLKYESYMPKDYYKSQTEDIKRIVLYTILGCFILILIITYFISRQVFKPMSDILFAFDETDKSLEELTNSNPEKLDEIRYIIFNIKKIMLTNRDITTELGKRLSMLNKAHYAMLQAQINPHFLYNTLESINWIVRKNMGFKNEASNTIDTLAKIFRLSTETENYLITLEEDIEYSKSYISILKTRYRELFDVIWNVDESLLSEKVVKLCIQPIVENAVYHGVKELEKGGIIKINIYRENEKSIVISISDNGVGIDSERLNKISESLNQNLEDRLVNTGKHIGIINVDERIKILFGNEYGIIVRSEINLGTEVKIRMPLTPFEAESKL